MSSLRKPNICKKKNKTNICFQALRGSFMEVEVDVVKDLGWGLDFSSRLLNASRQP